MGNSSINKYYAESSEKLQNLGRLKAMVDPRLFSEIPTFYEDFHLLPERLVIYLINNVSGHPWINQLVLYVVMANQENGTHSIYGIVSGLNTLYKWAEKHNFKVSSNMDIALLLHEFVQINGVIKTKLSQCTSAQMTQRRYFSRFPASIKEKISDLLLPEFDPNSYNLLTISSAEREKGTKERQKQVKPLKLKLTNITAVARLRLEWLEELYNRTEKVIDIARTGEISLPFDIQMDSINRSEKIIIRVWTRKTWISHHANQYHPVTVETYDKKKDFDRKDFFIELIGSKSANGWLINAIENDLIKASSRNGKAKKYLHARGMPGTLLPFSSSYGILFPDQGMGIFLSQAQQKASSVEKAKVPIFQLEPLLAAALIGYLAILIVSLTGMRMSEILQLNLENSIKLVQLPKYNEITESWEKDTGLAYVLEVFTKGKEQVQKAYSPKVIIDTIKKYIQFYRRIHGEKLKSIDSATETCFPLARHFRNKKYTFIFQWKKKHLSNQAITKCIDFLLLDYPIFDEDGNPIRITVHALRHGFAGYLKGEKGVALERIAVMLHHVNLIATKYYSQEPDDVIFGHLYSLLNEIGGALRIEPGIIRSLEDVRRFEEECLKRFGALRTVLGGKCGSYCSCEVMFKCARCESFIPVPERRHEIIERIAACEKAAALYTELGQPLQAERELLSIQDWKLALTELDAWANTLSFKDPDFSDQLELGEVESEADPYLTLRLLPSKIDVDGKDRPD